MTVNAIVAKSGTNKKNTAAKVLHVYGSHHSELSFARNNAENEKMSSLLRTTLLSFLLNGGKKV